MKGGGRVGSETTDGCDKSQEKEKKEVQDKEPGAPRNSPQSKCISWKTCRGERRAQPRYRIHLLS